MGPPPCDEERASTLSPLLDEGGDCNRFLLRTPKGTGFFPFFDWTAGRGFLSLFLPFYGETGPPFLEKVVATPSASLKSETYLPLFSRERRTYSLHIS